MAGAIRARPSFGADAKNRLLPGEIELVESPCTHLCYAAADEYRTMRWRTAPCHAEAVPPRISPLPSKLVPSRLVLEPEDVDSDVGVVEVDQAGLCVFLCVFVAAEASPSGHEVEFLIR